MRICERRENIIASATQEPAPIALGRSGGLPSGLSTGFLTDVFALVLMYSAARFRLDDLQRLLRLQKQRGQSITF